MASPTDTGARPRVPLNKERVLRAAVTLADAGGVESLSMRKLAQELGVEAMSLYNHVAGKDDVLDGIVDTVVSEIETTAGGDDWKAAMRRQAMAARKVLLRHSWAPHLITSRPRITPMMLRYFESVSGILRQAGFSSEVAHHAMHALGSRILGFTQELFEEMPQEEAAKFFEQISPEDYPNITKVLEEIDGHDDDVEFEFGLDLILDGLDRLRESG